MTRTLLPLLVALGLNAAPPELGPEHAFAARAAWTDALGQDHVRYQHAFRGRRVWGSEWIDHRGPGAQAPTDRLRLAGVPPPARRALTAPPPGAEPIYWPETVEVPVVAAPDATHVDEQVVDYRDAYFVPAGPDAPGGTAYDVVLDAATLETLAAIPVAETDGKPAKATGFSLYRGAVDLDVASWGPSYALLDLTRGKGGPFGGNFVGDGAYVGNNYVSLITSSTPTFGDGKPEGPGIDPTSRNGQTVAVDMAKGIQDTWDFFAQRFGRSGPDGTGRFVMGIAHPARALGTDNAMWRTGRTNQLLVLAPSQFMPLATLPILAHEFSHGLTEYTAGLIYRGESGSLNEANSDIFGALVDAWVANGRGATIGDANTDWRIRYYRNGTPSPSTPVLTRFMRKPSLALLVQSPDAWTPDLRDLDVHQGSGPMNRAFTFLSAGAAADPGDPGYSPYLPGGMAGLGNDKAADIWYRTLTTYLTASSTYRDARTGALSAAADLFGAGSREQAAVAQAFAAIHVGKAEVTPPATPPVTASVTFRGSQAVLAATSPSALTAVSFSVDGIPVGTLDAPPFTLTLDASRTLANGPHTLVADGFDAAGNKGTSSAVPFTLANPIQQLVRNPGFEAGSLGWTGFTGSVRLDPDRRLAYEGWRWLRFNAGGGGATRFLTQAVSIPGGSVQADLVFQMRARRADPDAAWEAGVRVTDASGLVLAQYLLPADAPQGAWVQHLLDLSAFQGRKIQVTCFATFSPGSAAYADFDDVRLLAGAQAPVRVSVSPAVAVAYLSAAPAPVTFTASVTGAADPSVTWSALGGGTLAGNVLTPPAAAGAYGVRATSGADPGAFWDGILLVRPALELFPDAVTLSAGGTAAFSLLAAPGAAPALALSGGADAGVLLPQTDPSRILYVAPATPGTYTLTATDAAGGGSASATVTVTASGQMAILPSRPRLATGVTLAFRIDAQDPALTEATWSVVEGSAGGSIGPDGSYTSPATPGVYHILARSVRNPTLSALATVTVLPGLVVEPAQATLLTGGGTVVFTATAPGNGSPSLLWSCPEAPGALNGSTFTAPQQAGTYTVAAASASGSALAAQARVFVKTTDFNGNGQTLFDWEDLAFLADAWGASPLVDAADLNGDGVVDDLDVALFAPRFQGIAP